MIKPDGSLEKYPTPTPSTPASIAAAEGDLCTLSSPPVKSHIWDKDQRGNIPSIGAAGRGQADAVTYIPSEAPPGADIHTRGFLGGTAFARAARGGRVSRVKALVELGDSNGNDEKYPDPNTSDEKRQDP